MDPYACANCSNAARLQELDYIAPEFGIPVQYHIPLGTGQRKRLSQLLYDPFARRMRRDVQVENAASAAFDHQGAISTQNVNVGTVKKSNAAITSRWLLRKANQRFALLPSW